jgi:hypothetical protein
MMMPRSAKPSRKTDTKTLKGWQEVSDFLGEPVSVVQRWSHEEMPVQREGRIVTTSPAELNDWLSEESGEPVRATTEDTDLTAELKRGLSYVAAKNSRQKPYKGYQRTSHRVRTAF